MAHAQEQLAEPGRQPGDVLRALGQEVLGLEPRRVDHLDVREDDLQGALEDLGLAPDVEVVARLEGPRQPLAGVPEPCADAPGLVPELQVEVEVPLAVGPELLVGDQVGLVDGVSVDQLIHIATSHAEVRPGACRIGDGDAVRARAHCAVDVVR